MKHHIDYYKLAFQLMWQDWASRIQKYVDRRPNYLATGQPSNANDISAQLVQKLIISYFFYNR